ncbi:MAG: hemerythrin [Myxococcaceae bacterium]|nr:hemerythrin [Myxococcaceae bacterium]
MKRTQRRVKATQSVGKKRASSERVASAQRGGASTGPDALELLKKDHRTVEALFKRFDKLGDSKKKEKQKLVSEIIRELSIHAAIEEQILYPASRKLVKATEDEVLEALEEHHLVKWTLSELYKMKPTDERFDAKVTVLKEMVEHHVQDEENELFPQLKKLGKDKLRSLGSQLLLAKNVAPTRPHPRAPDTPPGNVVAGMGSALVDRALDAGKSLVKKVRGGNGSKSKSKSNGHSSHASHA